MQSRTSGGFLDTFADFKVGPFDHHILGGCDWIRILCSIEVSLNTLLLCETALPEASGRDEQSYFDASYRDLLGPGT